MEIERKVRENRKTWGMGEKSEREEGETENRRTECMEVESER